MAESNTKLAIFDFDGTLTTGHLWVGIWRHHRVHNLKRGALNLYLISHLPFWLLARAGLYSEEKNRARWGEDLSILFKGLRPAEARQAFEWIRDNYFAARLREEMLNLIQDHRSQGHKIVLLSGMFEQFLEVVGERYGIDYVVGTKLESFEGVYSGKIVPPLCFGENKARLLLDFVRQSQLAIDFPGSTAYADSYYDLPVFKLVGHPVAAYPDGKLLEMARKNNWRVLGAMTSKAP